jgi:hypothetical protein
MMKKQTFAAIGVSSMLLAFSLFPPLKSNAEVNVTVTIPLPGLVISAPPAMIVIPGTYVYYPPEVDMDIFFYHGYWYRPYREGWYIANGYNGPWRTIGAGRVPRAVIGVPPHYRRVSSGYERMPYGTVRGNWRTWERERYWDRHERRRGYREDHDRGEHGGPGHGHGRGGMMGRHGDD